MSSLKVLIKYDFMKFQGLAYLDNRYQALRSPLTWTIMPGHRIRLAVSDALFPMIWPTPHAMMTKLFVGEVSPR